MPPTAASAPFRLHLLGDFVLQAPSGAPLLPLPGRAGALLMLLALAGDAGLERERAATLLWSDAPAERARQRLRQLLSDLRRIGLPLQADAGRLGWPAPTLWADVHAFQRGVASPDPAAVQAALALYRGPLATVPADDEGEFEGWRQAEQVRLERSALAACERLLRDLQAPDDTERRLEVLHRWLEIDPAAEAAHRALMQTWAALGRRADALDQFERCRDALHTAHGVRPQAETVALRNQLLRGDAPTGSSGPPAGEALTMALLPLSTLQRDAGALQGLADALFEELSAALSRKPALAVVAASMARAAAARAQGDLLRVAELLQVRFLVTGGLRRSADGGTRLSLNLVSGAQAMHLWSLQAEPAAEADLEEAAAAWAAEFELQANVAASRADPAAAGDEPAWAKVRQALRTMFERGWSEESVQASVQVYRDAIAADPGHALARAQKAILLALATNMGLRVGAAARDEARADAEQALRLAPRSSEVLGYAGCALADLGDARRAAPIVERAIAANPGNPQAWAAAGAAQLLLGHTEKGIAALERGLRLSPDDYRRPVWHTLLAGAYQRLGQLERALEHAQAGCRADALYHPARLALAALEIDRRNPAAARAALQEALRIRPQMLPAEARGWVRKRLFAQLLALWPAASGGSG